ncbi:GcrA cell cycle regulator [Faunimonas pinastri]|uniref:GcrA cell cycle regulator n=1 Tax=Faunimonas pinastri TaxID=1855383 RepID=A0A1H9I989_9HYPH|nr:GcrA family cell cycle regulator [Faunimonas pinastri]SEQ70965.1 GcrA cell cycle regulator [Faunimonas pinastri]
MTWAEFTPEQRGQAVQDAIAAGCLSASDIAGHLHVSRNAVIGVCQRRGIKLPNSGKPAPHIHAAPVPRPALPVPSRPRAETPAEPSAPPSKCAAEPTTATVPVPRRAPAPVPTGGIPFPRESKTQCAHPLWNDATPADDRRCCGQRVQPGAWREYCDPCLAKSAGITVEDVQRRRKLRVAGR